ncbi:MAG: (2Fe-2S)-binding protein [Deltaproteobacteria bacterium]|jgi:3-phenylpropionate/trans-cinnamate dioxygenase ferredoxin subunit|nr:MAG: (2Fe-2S)-binding protein [Deltaproteobacteria bacterium]
MGEFVKVAKVSDIPSGEVRSFVVNNEVIAICHVNGKFYAFKDECTHMAYPLSDGHLDGEIITCAYHGAKFNVRTGEVVAMPAVEPLEVFEVKVEGDSIYVAID